MNSLTPRLTRAAALAGIVVALGCPVCAPAQDAPSTQVTPTNTAPNATTQSSAEVKTDRKASKKQKHAAKANSKAGATSSGRVTKPSGDGQTDTDKARQNPNDKPSTPN